MAWFKCLSKEERAVLAAGVVKKRADERESLLKELTAATIIAGIGQVESYPELAISVSSGDIFVSRTIYKSVKDFYAAVAKEALDKKVSELREKANEIGDLRLKLDLAVARLGKKQRKEWDLLYPPTSPVAYLQTRKGLQIFNNSPGTLWVGV